MKLRERLRLVLFATFLGVSFLAGAVLMPYQLRQTRKSIEAARGDLRLAAELQEGQLLDLVFGSLWPAAGKKLEKLIHDSPRVSVAAVYDAEGTLREAATRAGFARPAERLGATVVELIGRTREPIRRETVGQNGWVVEYYQPLQVSGRTQGYLLLEQSLAEPQLQRHIMLAGTALLLGSLLLVLFALTGRFLRRNVVDRLAALAGLMKRAGSGALEVKYDGSGQDEIASIGHSFNTMVVGLRERELIKSTFGSYVSPEVVRRMLEGGQSVLLGQRRRVTVLFSDIRGFTTMAESQSPEAVVAMLNEYLNHMSGALSARGGRIDKFIGDAIMADWGALELNPDAELRATGSAVDMLAELERFNVARAITGIRPVQIGIGLNAGEVIAGTIGSAEKLEFTVIGDAVNLASRLEALCKVYGAQIVASASVWSAVRGAYPGRPLDHVVVKGKDASTKLYEILAPDDPRVATVPIFEHAMELYLARHFEEAVRRFAEARVGVDDPVCQFQIERCRALAKAPPGPEWDGIVRRVEK